MLCLSGVKAEQNGPGARRPQNDERGAPERTPQRREQGQQRRGAFFISRSNKALVDGDHIFHLTPEDLLHRLQRRVIEGILLEAALAVALLSLALLDQRRRGVPFPAGRIAYGPVAPEDVAGPVLFLASPAAAFCS